MASNAMFASSVVDRDESLPVNTLVQSWCRYQVPVDSCLRTVTHGPYITARWQTMHIASRGGCSRAVLRKRSDRFDDRRKIVQRDAATEPKQG